MVLGDAHGEVSLASLPHSQTILAIGMRPQLLNKSFDFLNEDKAFGHRQTLKACFYEPGLFMSYLTTNQAMRNKNAKSFCFKEHFAALPGTGPTSATLYLANVWISPASF